MANKNEDLERFSEDPLENLRIENEILKLNIQAECGGVFGTGQDVPPEIENQFLQRVREFEDAFRTVEFLKVYDLLGRPPFIRVEDLEPGQIVRELTYLKGLLAGKNIMLHTCREYDPFLIYKFITEELFEVETENITLPGWSKNYIYEEFYPEEDEN